MDALKLLTWQLLRNIYKGQARTRYLETPPGGPAPLYRPGLSVASLSISSEGEINRSEDEAECVSV